MIAITTLSEIGNDMSVLPSSKHFTSWAVCCPRNDQSAKHLKSTQISRAGAWIKPLLVQISNVLIRSRRHPEFRERYLRIKARRGRKKLSLLYAGYSWPLSGTLSQSLSLIQLMAFQRNTPLTKKGMSAAEAIKPLKSRDYIIKDSPGDPLTA